MEEKKVYLVYPDGEYYSTPLAIFEERRKAVEFTKRFRVNPKYAIVNQPLNPSFEQNPTNSPFKVTFHGRETVVVSLLSSGAEEVELALAGKHRQEHGELDCYVLAADEADAVSKAAEIRDKLIRNHKWKPM